MRVGNDLDGMSSAYSNIADFYRKNQEFKEALNLYDKSLRIEQELNSGYSIGIIYYFKGELYNDMEILDSAMIYLLKADSIFHIYDYSVRLAHSKNLLGRVNLKLTHYPLAEKQIFESFDYAFMNNQYSTISSNYAVLALLYSETGDYKKAYEYLEKYRHLKDSIFSEEMRQKLDNIQRGYEIERKDNEIRSLNEKQKIQELLLEQKNYKLKRQRIASLTLIIITLLIGSLVLILLRQKFKKDRAYMLLEEKNNQIKKSQKELRHAKEKAEESDKLKTAFLANITHEIRNPLNVILGMSEIIAKNNFTDSQKEEYLNMINVNGEQLLTIINDVLDMAKIESGVINTTVDKFDEAEFFNELRMHFDNYRQKINKEHIDIRCELTSAKNSIVSDRYKLRQIFSNLMINALKFTEKGYIVIGDIMKDGERIFYVKDTGIGISKKDQKIIFNRFIQADNFLTKKYQGTGLGLAIAKSLVTILDGTIWVESEVGKGSTFYFTIHSENGN